MHMLIARGGSPNRLFRSRATLFLLHRPPLRVAICSGTICTLSQAKTMVLRVRKQSENAQLIAEFLETHAAVDVVRYPGLPSFPQKALADKQHRDGTHGGVRIQTRTHAHVRARRRAHSPAHM